jgi:hypothetical protein
MQGDVSVLLVGILGICCRMLLSAANAEGQSFGCVCTLRSSAHHLNFSIEGAVKAVGKEDSRLLSGV